MGWPMEKLGDLVDFMGGGTPSKAKDEYYGGSIPWATVRDMSQECLTHTELSITERAVKDSSTKIIPAGTVIIATRVGLGKVCILGQATAINQDLKALIPKCNRLDTRYLFWWLKSVSHVIEAAGVGATVKGVKLPFVKGLLVPVPSLEEQTKIVAILDETFADIDKARELTERNFKNARELFESYLQQAFLPENHWETNKLSSVCQIKPPKKEAREVLNDTDKVSFVPMDCLGISQKKLQLKYERTLSEVAGSYTYFGEDDVLLAKITPCFENGKLGIARGLTNRIGFGSSEFIVFRCGDRMAPDYLYYYLSRQRFIEEGQPLMTGAVGHKRVSKDFIENYSISYPPLSEQKQICGRLDRARAEIDRIVAIYETKLNYLSELRNSLLANTFSGKLKKA